jgi:hypothetical protein
MSILLFTLGLLVSAVSALVLVMIARTLISAQQTLRAHGVTKTMPVDRWGGLVIGAWTIGLIVGVSLIVMSYR